MSRNLSRYRVTMEELKNWEKSLVRVIEDAELNIQGAENLLVDVRAEMDARLTLAENEQEAKID